MSLNTSVTVYGILTELPAIFLFYDSAFWSGAFLLFIFSVSVWNGGGYYIEVFGRKCVFSLMLCFLDSVHISSRFERELEMLRKELAEATAARSGRSTPTSGPDTLSRAQSDEDLSSLAASPDLTLKDLPSMEVQHGVDPVDVKKVQ
jgi:hypothetical protein